MHIFCCSCKFFFLPQALLPKSREITVKVICNSEHYRGPGLCSRCPNISEIRLRKTGKEGILPLLNVRVLYTYYFCTIWPSLSACAYRSADLTLMSYSEAVTSLDSSEPLNKIQERESSGDL